MVTVTADVERQEPIGQTVGNYKILHKLSTGGMGTVYYAEHALIGRSAAVKVLHPELSGSKEVVNRFFNEAKATTSIKHPGIVEIFDYGYLPTGDGYIIMEFLDGMSLARRLKKGGHYGEGEAAMLVRGVCSALAAAHHKGIVHRDLKPDNIFLIEDADSPIGERPKVLDFGIAKLTDIGLAGAGTKTGAVMGTPTYMSPEQCRGTGQVDHRADLYSLGCILYELCCGRPPFKNLGAGELIGAHQHLVPSPPSKHNPAIGTEMEQLIMNLLDKDPAKRVQTAPELARYLAQIATKHGYQISMTHMTPVPGLPVVPRPSSDDAATSMTELAPVSNDMTTEPTTLSHGAAQSVASIPASRPFAWKIALPIALVAAAAIAFVTVNAMRTTTSDRGATGEQVQPAAPPTSPVAKPADPPPPTPVVAPPVEPPPVEPPPVEPPVVEPTVKPADPVEPAIAAPKRAKPRAKPAKPKPAKPAKPPDPAKPKPRGPLENDI
jgi:serine/threonine protein kinase